MVTPSKYRFLLPSSKSLATILSPLKRWLWPLMLLLGLVLRVAVYWQNRSLFLDEANLARNIAELSWVDFFAPLHYQQYAPPLFLILEKLNWFLVGTSEYSLRFWPLIMGCLTLLGMYFLLRRLVGTDLPSLFVFYLFAFSQTYIRYSTELKQYSTDMAVATALIGLALQYPPSSRKRWFLWILLGCISIWLSMPSIFILAGVGAYFLFIRRRQQSVSMVSLFVLGIIWLASFGGYYTLILSSDLQKTELLSYHQPYFWPLWPDSWSDWQQLYHITQSLISTLIGHTVMGMLIGLTGLAAGLLYLGRKQATLIYLLFMPILLCLIASGLGRYSLMERLSLFMMPSAGIVLAMGLVFLNKQLNRWGQWALTICCLAILPLRKGLEYIYTPLQYEEMRPLLMELDQQLSPTDIIWIDHFAEPAFKWYTEYAPLPVNFPSSPSYYIYNSWDGIAHQELMDHRPETGRVWMIFSHLVSKRNRQDLFLDLEPVRQRWGEPVLELRYPGSVGYGWEFE